MPCGAAEGREMKNLGTFIIVIVLIAVAVLAVLCVTYPELQEPIKVSLENTGKAIGNFFNAFFEPIKKAFVK